MSNTENHSKGNVAQWECQGLRSLTNLKSVILNKLFSVSECHVHIHKRGANSQGCFDDYMKQYKYIRASGSSKGLNKWQPLL